MEIPANYIKRIEIHGLWQRYNIVWNLEPDVNILPWETLRIIFWRLLIWR